MTRKELLKRGSSILLTGVMTLGLMAGVPAGMKTVEAEEANTGNLTSYASNMVDIPFTVICSFEESESAYR